MMGGAKESIKKNKKKTMKMAVMKAELFEIRKTIVETDNHLVKKVMGIIDIIEKSPDENHLEKYIQKLDLDTALSLKTFMNENSIVHTDRIVKEVCPILIHEYGALDKLLTACKAAKEAIVKAVEYQFVSEYSSQGRVSKNDFEKQLEARLNFLQGQKAASSTSA